jgi:hypothetical protein
MGYRGRIYFTERQKAEIWDRWQRGESMSSIGRLFDRNSVVHLPGAGEDRRHPSCGAAKVATGSDPGGTRGGLQRVTGPAVSACYRPPITEGPVDN